MKLIYKPWGVDQHENKRGFPADYPRESTRIDDNDPIPEGWIEITELDYKLLVESAYAEVASINAQFEATEKSNDAQKLDALKRLFDDGQVINDGWATATNVQKFELCRTTFKILSRQRRQILDQYRPE